MTSTGACRETGDKSSRRSAKDRKSKTRAPSRPAMRAKKPGLTESAVRTEVRDLIEKVGPDEAARLLKMRRAQVYALALGGACHGDTVLRALDALTALRNPRRG